MNKLTLVFLFSIITTAYVQDIGNSPVEQSPSDDLEKSKEEWIQQFQGHRRKGKPCARRRSNNPDEPWIPSYSSKITHPLPKVLQPQALKNEEHSQALGQDEPQINRAAENEYKLETRRSEESGRRNDDDDCVDTLVEVNLRSQPKPDPETTALKMIEDCLRKKKGQTLGPSRRSMSETEHDSERAHEDENSEAHDSGTDDYTKKEDEVKNVSDARRHDLTKQNTQQQLQTGQNNPNQRICYACSTATNPTCWEPDSRTTIKYCRKEQSCVTKTFGVKHKVTLIRDCANSCGDTSVAGIEPKYKTCKICHKDYCNSAMGIAFNAYNFVIVLIISIVKCTS